MPASSAIFHSSRSPGSLCLYARRSRGDSTSEMGCKSALRILMSAGNDAVLYVTSAALSGTSADSTKALRPYSHNHIQASPVSDENALVQRFVPVQNTCFERYLFRPEMLVKCDVLVDERDGRRCQDRQLQPTTELQRLTQIRRHQLVLDLTASSCETRCQRNCHQSCSGTDLKNASWSTIASAQAKPLEDFV